ncbi:MAG TPA: hypothetical protein VN887_19170, partial [Candidatus Angelobacter sp.]|nr:hypothetical protein [Candidatus Angelobacter sp.]
MKFDVRSDDGLIQTIGAMDELIDRAEQEGKERRQHREEMVTMKPPAEMTRDELSRYFNEPDGRFTRHDLHGLKEIRRLARAVLETRDVASRERLIHAMEEITSAINNNHRLPVPANLDFIEFPFAALERWRYSIGQGHRRATNLDARSNDEGDPGKEDPVSSTFWSRPPSISDRDVYHGFGRNELPRFEDPLCIYDAPKTSYGTNPGFEVRCGGLRMKVKFGETSSEPFTARIFWALGYHVDPTDHAEHLKIRYDRRLLREFHQRKEIKTTFRLLGFIPLYTMKLQRRYDPFDYIAFAAMKDGGRISGSELKRRLFRDSRKKHPEDEPENFRPEVEAQIDHLVTVAANVQIKEENTRSIGPWDFGQAGHENLRELRGAGLLAAWLGWFDSRFENTRLKLVATDDGKELRHYFSDLGGGLGEGSSFFSPRGERPDRFTSSFTKSSAGGRFRIVGFKPIERTAAFEEMTVDDARWMARLIAQLREEQIARALTVSGFDPAQVRLYTEKLV